MTIYFSINLIKISFKKLLKYYFFKVIYLLSLEELGLITNYTTAFFIMQYFHSFSVLTFSFMFNHVYLTDY